MWVWYHVPSILFVFCFGACVGSFVNVLNHRLPAGMSVINPPSRCPTCGGRLRFLRENIPILGWLLLRGRCRYCRIRISPGYMCVELLMALIFLGLYVLLFMVAPRTPWWGEIGGAWWAVNGPRAAPSYFVLALLLAGLVSMTMIDARTFTIPIEIPVGVTTVAMIGYGAQGLIPTPRPRSMTWPLPGITWSGTAMALGGMVGLVVAIILLRRGVLRTSFADYDEYVSEGEVLGVYPHARREMWVEIKYLAPILLGLAVGWFAGGSLPAEGPPRLVQALAIPMAGYLVGAGLVWAIRILGTLGFGREAMGMGDVHLMGAIGAALGWFEPILIFFVAPFSGLLWALMSIGLGSVFRMMRRQLPYGPHLALATLLVILCRPGIHRLCASQLPIRCPVPGLVP